MNLNEKVILITGGSRGIGAAMVKACHAAGAKVAFTYRSSAGLADKIVEELGDGVKAYQSDAADFDAADQLVKEVAKDLGPIFGLINNAGITKDNLLLRMSEEQWDQVMHVNLKSAYNLTKHCMRPMMKQRKGSIINVSSVVGMFGNAGQSNYAASKAGLIGFTKSIAKEVGSRNIRCNAIAPGFIATEMTDELDEKTKEQFLANIPLQRYGTANEVANLCVFLLSDQSAYISGQAISICGALNT